IYPLYRGNILHDVFQSKNWHTEEVFDFMSDLTLGSNHVLRQMQRGRRKNIKKAETRFKIETSISNNLEGLRTFLKHYDQTCRDRGLIPPHRSFFDAVLEVLVERGYAQIFLASQDGNDIASKIVLTYGNIVYDWFAGSLPPARESKANDKLVWDIIEWSVERGFRNYYYGGAETTESVRGIYEYKRRFGGELVNFNRYVKVHRPVRNWMVQKVLPMYKKLDSRKK
ncbi:MAG: GNAT family N-acetyltransferase, partial [Thermoplasmata archaeon]|nr:GNAT family N-acetyltransferase [Thermoplasmata archaeon]